MQIYTKCVYSHIRQHNALLLDYWTNETQTYNCVGHAGGLREHAWKFD